MGTWWSTVLVLATLARTAVVDRDSESFSDTVTIVPPRRGENVELHLEWDYVDVQGVLPGHTCEMLPVH